MLLTLNNALRSWRSHLTAGLLLACAACGGGGGDPAPPSPLPVVVPPATAPSIGTQPQNASAVDGARASFSVVAAGTAPLSYQWQLDGKNIDGATQSSYSTAALRLTDSGGQYRVVISNAGGSLTSNAAVLTVQAIALAMGSQPKSASVADGAAATFSVEATGSGPIDYQWMRGGSSIAGATGPSYTTPALGLADSKSEFQVLITNPAGTIASDKVAVTVTPVAPMITSQPASLTVADTGMVNLSVSTTGSAPQSFQWKRNGAPIANAISASYSFVAAYSNNGDKYSVSVSNIAAAIDSQAAIVTVSPLAAAFSSQPQPMRINPGSPASFSASVTGTGPLIYQWQRSMDGGVSWVSIAGATDSSHTVASATLGDTAARFRLQVGNPQATTYSQAAELTVIPNVRVVAGALGGSGYAEGQGAQARFSFPSAIATDMNGNIYVGALGAEMIRRVSLGGQTSAFAGKPDHPGHVDGQLSNALFEDARLLTFDTQGNLFVGDTCLIRKISADGVVSTVAGSKLTCKRPADGQGAAAGFTFITGLAADANGNLYVADENATIRKVSPSGAVTTLAGSFEQRGTADGVGSAARFRSPAAITVDTAGNVFVVDGSSVRRMTPGGTVSLFAGAPDSWGERDGDRLAAARFFQPAGLAFDLDGNLFVTEYRRIVRIDKSGLARTIAGNPDDTSGRSVDGVGTAARVVSVRGIARLPNGHMVFAEAGSHSLRTIAPDGSVRTLAGLAPQTGTQDGPSAASRFSSPETLITDSGCAILVADRENNRIRRIGIDGLVSTIAGGSYGTADGAGTAAAFSRPIAVARDPAGNLFVADHDSHTIRKISPAGDVTTFAGKADEIGRQDGAGSAARFYYPWGIAVDQHGNVFVADSQNHAIRKITPAGVVSTFAGLPLVAGGADGKGASASFDFPMGLAFDGKNNLYVADYNTHSIRRIAPDGTVSTYAGAAYAPGHKDGAGSQARFFAPHSLAFDSSDNLYVADTNNNVIRRVTPGGFVSTVIGSRDTAAVRLGPGGTINAPTGVAVLPNGRLVFISEQAVLSD